MSNPSLSRLQLAAGVKFDIEQLEQRTLLSGVSSSADIPVFTPTSTSLTDVRNGPFTKAGGNLASLYTSYLKWRRDSPVDKLGQPLAFSPDNDLFIRNGNLVEVSVRSRTSVTSLVNELRSLGIQTVNRDARNGLIDMFIPIGQLHTLMLNSNVASVQGVYKPYMNQEGSVDNQANQAMVADKARAIFGADGTGIKVGVLSDSVDSAGGGLADSQSTGDLGHVEVVDSSGFPFSFGTDEGRAMLELIHDIAPGASLAFATANGGQQAFADNIIALQEAGCNVIVDDVGYPNEPFFQDGIVAQAISVVRSRGAVYLSAAGNGGFGGFQQQIDGYDHRPDGRTFVDFRPGNGVDSTMDIEVNQGGSFTLQWDNPWNGVTGKVTANLDITFRDKASGTIVAQGNDDNFFTGAPVEIFNLPSGDLEMTIELTGLKDADSLPKYFKITSGQSELGDTEYPGVRSTTFGHNSSQWTISVGAVPFFQSSPFVDDIAQLANSSELFSSSGPVTNLFKGNGERRGKSSILTLQKPDVSGIDGGNTSFFDLENDSNKDSDAFPNFFGTSAAAPDVAAVAALIMSFKPNLTPDEVQAALISSAKIHPLNNAKHNTWDPQGGFGLVDATRALQVLDDAPYVNISRVNPDPRSTPVDSVSFTFSRAVGGFDLSDLVFAKDSPRKGVTMDTLDGVTLSTDDNVTWVLNGLSNLTTANGTYILTLKANGSIIDGSGHALKADEREQFHIQDATPEGPSSLTATAITRSSIQLEWLDNSNNETRFKLERGTNPDFTAGLKVINVPANTTKVVDGNLDQNTKYYYRLRAFSPNGYSAATRTSAFTLSNGDIIVDNSTASKKGNWATLSSGFGIFKDDYLTDGNSAKGKKSVTFTPNLPISGKYFVYARWPSGSNRATNVPIDITSADGLTTVVKDQKNTGKNGAWVLLGTFNFEKGTAGSVTIRTNGTNGLVVADAVRFLSSAPVTNKEAESVSVQSMHTVAMANIFASQRIAHGGDDDLLNLI
jgi:hypothetical protein